jgi:hypothetical protein
MNQLLSENRFCHCEHLSVIFYKGKLLIVSGDGSTAWFGIKNYLIRITSRNLCSGHWFTFFLFRTQWLRIIRKISTLNVIAIFNIILQIALSNNITFFRLWRLSIIHNFDTHISVHVSLNFLFDSILIKFRN